MRTREEIVEHLATFSEATSHEERANYIQVELLLDIRELLLKQTKDPNATN